MVFLILWLLSCGVPDGCDIYTNLATDPALFQGQGDLQFDVYREMQIVNG